MNWTSDGTANNKGFDWGMYRKGRGGVDEKIWKPRRLFQNTNCDWVRICIRNKKEEVEWRNRSLAAPNPIVPSLSDSPRHHSMKMEIYAKLKFAGKPV